MKVRVVSETTPEGAEILLSQGVRPGFKRKFPVNEFAPGRGIDRDNLYVAYPNAFSRGSFGRVRLTLEVDMAKLAVSPEQAQLGVSEVDQALRTVDGGVTQGRLPRNVFTKVEVWKGGGRWETMTPAKFLNNRTIPELPSPGEYRAEIERNAEAWFLSPRKVDDLVVRYRRADLGDKIMMAQEVGLVESQDTLDAIKQTMRGLTPSVDYGLVWFNPETGQLCYSLADGDEGETYDEWEAAFNKIEGVKEVEGDAEIGAPDGPGWLRVGSVQGEGPRFESLVESLNFDWALRGEVPAEPGTKPIPAGHVRLYHYTRIDEASDLARHRAAESMRRQGILFSKAKGKSYGEPNQVWASTRVPPMYKVYAEFSVSLDDPRILIGRNSQMTPQQYMKSGWDMTFNDNIKPREIIAVHEPWHHRYRHLVGDRKLIQRLRDGIYDKLMDNPEYGPAVLRAKRDLGLTEDRQALDQMIDVQALYGNWNYDPYMHGLVNGMILGRHTAFDEEGEPPFLEAPDEWLTDRPFEAQVEAIFDQKNRERRKADRGKSRQGRYATRDYKQVQGHRHGQRRRSQRRTRVSEDTVTALELLDGTIIADPDGGLPTHADLMTKLGVDPAEILDGGFVVDGVYRQSSSHARGAGERARARQRAMARRRGLRDG